MNEKLQTISYVEYLDRKVFMEYVSNDSQEKSQVWKIYNIWMNQQHKPYHIVMCMQQL
jgi:hypothetical protein